MDETHPYVAPRTDAPGLWPAAPARDDIAAATPATRRRDKLIVRAVLALAGLMMLGVLGLVSIAAAAAHSSRDLSAHDHLFGVSRPVNR